MSFSARLILMLLVFCCCARRICGTGIKGSQSQVVLLPRSQVQFVFLVVYRAFILRLPVRSRGIVVITLKVSAGSARHGRQCRSSRPSLTLALGRSRLILHMLIGGEHIYLVNYLL